MESMCVIYKKAYWVKGMEINYELRLKRNRSAEEWAGDDKK